MQIMSCEPVAERSEVDIVVAATLPWWSYDIIGVL